MWGEWLGGSVRIFNLSGSDTMRNALRTGCGKFSALLVSLTIILATGSNAWGVVLAYEGFNYPAGEFLVVYDGMPTQTQVAPIHNGGTGWAGAWVDDTAAPASPATNFSSVTQASSLTYTDGLGNSLTTTGGKLLLSGETGISQPSRTMANRRASNPESGAPVTTWVSFLGARIGDLDPSGTFAGTYRRGANLAFFDTGTGAVQAEKFSLGESSNNQYQVSAGPPIVYEDRWQARLAGVPGGVTVPQPYPPNPTGSGTAGQVRDAHSSTVFNGTTALAVVRIDHVPGDSNNAAVGNKRLGNDNIYVWMNPNLNSEPNIANASIKLESNFIVSAANALATPIAPFNGTPSPVFPDLPGDYNQDGIVNAPDYVVWRDNENAAVTLPNTDINDFDGMVTTAEYDFWKTQFGNAAPPLGAGGEFDFNRFRPFAGNVSGTTPFAQLLFDELRVGETFADVTPFTGPPVGAGVGAPIPEPATWLLGALACVVWSVAGRRRRAA